MSKKKLLSLSLSLKNKIHYIYIKTIFLETLRSNSNNPKNLLLSRNSGAVNLICALAKISPLCEFVVPTAPTAHTCTYTSARKRAREQYVRAQEMIEGTQARTTISPFRLRAVFERNASYGRERRTCGSFAMCLVVFCELWYRVL